MPPGYVNFCVPARMLVLLNMAFKNKLTLLPNDLYENRLAKKVLTTASFGHNTILKMSGIKSRKRAGATKALGMTATGMTRLADSLVNRSTRDFAGRFYQPFAHLKLVAVPVRVKWSGAAPCQGLQCRERNPAVGF